MEILFLVILVLIALNVAQMWMNSRLIQGKEVGLPQLAGQILVLVQQNQQQLIEALKERAAATPDPRDDILAALFEKYLPALLAGVSPIPTSGVLSINIPNSISEKDRAELKRQLESIVSGGYDKPAPAIPQQEFDVTISTEVPR